ncbi:splicing factor, arginine/serine-rich 15-like isoform X1 [Mizuhopecten yessoensis]|uniref:splicing factor, arginine/serine-rich 15-like isoform X1 n=1 Tax=Mizuhopecten yessoensis TaxID=6573 RepID=UPI000B45E473|nr:splicing factor, arginine/serine-rich 15-like isoform X1 [Mizuhopecten yessoensis]
MTINYCAIAGLSIIGCILLFCNVIIGFVGCASTRPGRPIQNQGGILFISAGCTIAAVVWFYITQYHDTLTSLSSTSLNIKLGYSFYLGAVAGGGTFIAAITMCVTANKMDVPVAQQGPTGYPQPGFPQPGYPQSGNPQPGYPQHVNPQPGYPQHGNPHPGYPQPGHSQPGYPQPGHSQPGYPQHGNPQPGYTQPGHSQPGYPQHGNPQPGYPQPGNPQPGYPQHGNPQPGYPQPGNP